MERRNQTFLGEFIFLAFSSSSRFPGLLFFFFSILYCVILAMNIILMLVIKADSRLHTPMYVFLFNLSCLDICYTTTVIPQTLCNLLSSKHSISFHGCATQTFFIVLFGGTQIVLITSMAYDRCVAITNPLRYKVIMTKATCVSLVITPWIISSLMAGFMVFSVFHLPFCDTNEINHFFCDAGQVLAISCPSPPIHELVEIILFSIVLVLFAINFLFVLTTYMFIISAIMKIKTKQGQRKAFSNCSSHINVVVVEYACLGFLYLRPKTAYGIDKDKIFVIVFTFGTPILNPFIYSVRNKAVKIGFKKLIK
uniref:G-protein coupled receptors family 1 profile domain-containing protein n=1 Tax=Pyxicephalus adspersus TaxID=30357 RepID=A0AAV3A9A5_PYXAD|nr:TPA: hypothetical protein GDO54_010243 [Pyxicephalus adspersus]